MFRSTSSYYMKKLSKAFGFIMFAFALFVADLVIKYFITMKFQPGETISFANSWITIGRIENLRLPLGFVGGLDVVGYITIAVQLLFLMLFIRIQIRDVDPYFKYSSVLIVFGWIGNYLDRLFFAKGNWAYMHMDYFNLALAGKSVINLSSLMILIGWFLLLVVALLKFSEFKSLFRKNASLSSAK